MFPIPGLSDHYFPVKTEVFFLYQSQFCSVNIFLILSRKNVSKLLETPTLWFWGGGTLANFLSFPTFSNHFTPIWLKMTHNGKFRLSQNGQFGMFFYVFPQNEAEIDSEWSISPDSQLFPSFATKVSHFWRNLKNFCFGGGGYICKFFEFYNFFKSFQMNVAQNHPQLQIWQKKWIRLGQNCQI